MLTAIGKLKSNMSDSLLCCGLDPDLAKIPDELRSLRISEEEKVLQFLKGVIDTTSAYVCAYKAQKAFFDLFSGGHDLLKAVIAYVHEVSPMTPVILDCKIGDIDNTMGVYLDNIFGRLAADGVVVNPYMGEEVMLPFVDFPEKAIVVLAKTSNPGGASVQDLVLENGLPLWKTILYQITNRWNVANNLIPVVSSTAGLDMAHTRTLIPDEMPILLAGVGAQGGSYEDLGLLLNSQRSGVFVNSSRGLLYPPRIQGEQWQEAILKATITLRNNLEHQR